MAICPACEAEIEIDEFDVEKGDTVSCPDCGETLEVTSISPVELDVVGEDEDEDEDEFDEKKDELSDTDEDEEDWDE